MTIQEYVTMTLTSITDQLDGEPNKGQWMTVDFDIGVDTDNKGQQLIVEQGSTNRIKFSIDIKLNGEGSKTMPEQRLRGHGTVEGGRKAAQTNKKRYGADFYKRIGAIGGTKSNTGGFKAMTKEQVSAAGRLGGAVSRRGKSKLSPMERKLAHNRHVAKYADLYKDSSEQVAKLSQKFGKVV